MCRSPTLEANISGKLKHKELAIIVAAVLLGITLYLGALLAFSDASFGAEDQPNVPPVQPVRPCKTVTAKVFNRRVRVLDKITGKRHHKASRKVCKSHYRKLGKKIRKARADCLREAPRGRTHTTQASVFWPGSDSGGMISACNVNLWNVHYGFAELGSGRAMGGLPCGTIIYLRGPTGVIAIRKIDTGCGNDSPRCESPGRDIDLYDRTGLAVGVHGTARVRWSLHNCWA